MAMNTVTTSKTNYSETDGKGNIFYMDRHEPFCAKGAISFFKLDRKSGTDQVQYRNSCINSDAITGTVKNENTAYNVTSGTKSVNFFDRHDVSCAAGTVLRSFRLARKSGDITKVRYNYSCVTADTLCCKTYQTTPTDMGNRSAYYLDRQSVGKEGSKDWAMRRFQLHSKYSPDRLYYTYEMCKLNDMDAVKAVEQANLTLKANQKGMLETAQALEAAKAAYDALQAKMKQMEILVAKSQGLLTVSQAAPGLTC